MSSGENEEGLQKVLDKIGDIDLSNFNIGNLEEMSGEEIQDKIEEMK
ncbi:hypothetical protein HRED_06762 [Candidatus Haloredivivus sp. G17]|nr:hypothetical protein HRED_06762 [Candidatus Haloredivivus sp. G17]